MNYLLAKHLRKHLRFGAVATIDAPVDGPTKLLHFALSSECAQFLRETIAAHESRRKEESLHIVAGAYFFLALSNENKDSLAERLRLIQKSQEAIETLVGTRVHADAEFMALASQIARYRKFLNKQHDDWSQIHCGTVAVPTEWTIAQVDRRNDLDLVTFLKEYAIPGRPVIVMGDLGRVCDRQLDFELLAELLDCDVPLKRHVPQSMQWAKLEDAQPMNGRQFLAQLLDGSLQNCYLFDWSLALFAPEALVNMIQAPAFCRETDYLRQLSARGAAHMFAGAWPSLFVAPTGTHADMHVDSFGSNFWMHLFEGEKQWTFFRPEDVHRLEPKVVPTTGALVFDASSLDRIGVQCKLAKLAVPTQCTLKAGETLFVPAGSPHFVENLTHTIAVSGNYVDCSNLTLVLEELGNAQYADETSADLRRLLLSFEPLALQERLHAQENNVEDMFLDTFEQQFQ